MNTVNRITLLLLSLCFIALMIGSETSTNRFIAMIGMVMCIGLEAILYILLQIKELLETKK